MVSMYSVFVCIIVSEIMNEHHILYSAYISMRMPHQCPSWLVEACQEEICVLANWGARPVSADSAEV